MNKSFVWIVSSPKSYFRKYDVVGIVTGQENVVGLQFQFYSFNKTGNIQIGYFKKNTNVASAAIIPTKIKAFLTPWYPTINSLIIPYSYNWI